MLDVSASSATPASRPPASRSPLAFFALFGFIFLMTQYFQFVRGYWHARAGVHTLPFAVVAGVAAPIAARAVHRFGTQAVVAAGLASMAVGFVCRPRRSTPTRRTGAIVVP